MVGSCHCTFALGSLAGASTGEAGGDARRASTAAQVG